MGRGRGRRRGPETGRQPGAGGAARFRDRTPRTVQITTAAGGPTGAAAQPGGQGPEIRTSRPVRRRRLIRVARDRIANPDAETLALRSQAIAFNYGVNR